MRYTIGGQDAHPTGVLLFNPVPQKSEICCNIYRIERELLSALLNQGMNLGVGTIHELSLQGF
jgi:hypothetical protein